MSPQLRPYKGMLVNQIDAERQRCNPLDTPFDSLGWYLKSQKENE